jgi:hypothetical protein
VRTKSNILRMIMPKSMRLTGHVALMRENFLTKVAEKNEEHIACPNTFL